MWEKRFIQSKISCQNESVSSQCSSCHWSRFNLHSQKFVEWVYKFPLAFSQSSHKPQKMAESSNKFITLDKPIELYIQEQQNKITWAKTWWDIHCVKTVCAQYTFHKVIYISCSLRVMHCDLQQEFPQSHNESFIEQARSAQDGWILTLFFFACLWMSPTYERESDAHRLA